MQDTWGDNSNDQVKAFPEFENWKNKAITESRLAGADIALDIRPKLDYGYEAEKITVETSQNEREYLTLNPNGRPLSELRVVGDNLFNLGLQTNQPIPSVAKTAAKVTAEKIILGSTDERFNLSKQCAGNSLDFFANIA
jgi:hypothetical protein